MTEAKKTQGQAECATITTKSGRKSASSDPKGVTKTLAGVMKGDKEVSPPNDTPDKPPGESESLTGVTTSSDNALAGVTSTLSGVTITNKTEPTISLSGVTSSKLSNVWPNMMTNELTTQDGKNSMLLAIARLETKLLENHETDLNNVEEHLTTSMKSIVDNSIKDALKTLTGSINKVVAEDPEIKKHKRNISQLQTENLRLTQKVQVLDNEYNKLKTRINTIEQKALDHTLILRRIAEIQEETESSLKDGIFAELSQTIAGDSYEEKLSTARCMEIRCCK